LTTYVFVPGAFHGGWSFDRVRPMLERAGHRMLSPTLSGVGERAHLAALGSIDLDTHIEDIVQLILWHGLKDIVLAGHSYGGMVITGVADRVADRIATLCYLDAAMPGNGDSLISLLPALVAPVAAASEVHGGRLVDPPPAAAFGVGPVYREWVDARLTPHPIEASPRRSACPAPIRRSRGTS
jgi:pimeloyl-ACP methyl ester carboxylesterase